MRVRNPNTRCTIPPNPPLQRGTLIPPVKKTAPTTSTSSSAKIAKGTPAPAAEDTFKYRFTSEDADIRIVDLIPGSVQTDFADANWKARLAALEEMTTWLESGEVERVESELIVRFLAKKGWSEKNFQVCKVEASSKCAG